MTKILAIINAITDRYEKEGFRIMKLEYYTESNRLFIVAEAIDGSGAITQKVELEKFIKKGE